MDKYWTDIGIHNRFNQPSSNRMSPPWPSGRTSNKCTSFPVERGERTCNFAGFFSQIFLKSSQCYCDIVKKSINRSTPAMDPF